MIYKEAIAKAKTDYLRAAMEEAGGCAAQAARNSGLDRTHFHDLLVRHGIIVPTKPQARRGRWKEMGLSEQIIRRAHNDSDPQLREALIAGYVENLREIERANQSTGPSRKSNQQPR